MTITALSGVEIVILLLGTLILGVVFDTIAVISCWQIGEHIRQYRMAISYSDRCNEGTNILHRVLLTILGGSAGALFTYSFFALLAQVISNL